MKVANAQQNRGVEFARLGNIWGGPIESRGSISPSGLNLLSATFFVHGTTPNATACKLHKPQIMKPRDPTQR